MARGIVEDSLEPFWCFDDPSVISRSGFFPSYLVGRDRVIIV